MNLIARIPFNYFSIFLIKIDMWHNYSRHNSFRNAFALFSFSFSFHFHPVIHKFAQHITSLTKRTQKKSHTVNPPTKWHAFPVVVLVFVFWNMRFCCIGRTDFKLPFLREAREWALNRNSNMHHYCRIGCYNFGFLLVRYIGLRILLCLLEVSA